MPRMLIKKRQIPLLLNENYKRVRAVSLGDPLRQDAGLPRSILVDLVKYLGVHSPVEEVSPEL
jgi:hypothetical protein